MAFRSLLIKFSESSIIQNHFVHYVLYTIESIIFTVNIISALSILSNQSHNKVLSFVQSYSFHSVYFRYCMQYKEFYIMIILIAVVILIEMILCFSLKLLGKFAEKINMIISLVYELLFNRYLSMIIIESLVFYIVNTTVIEYNIIRDIAIEVLLFLYLIRCSMYILTNMIYIQIGNSQNDSNSTNIIDKNSKSFSYPFDAYFSKVYCLFFLFGKLFISIGLNLNTNKITNTSTLLVNNQSQTIIMLYCYLSMIIGCYLYFIVNVFYYNKYHIFSLNTKMNLFCFMLLQMNIFVIISLIWLFSSVFHMTFFILCILSSIVISISITWLVFSPRIKQRFINDIFSLHQMLYLIGNDKKDKENIIGKILNIIISHISQCQFMMKNQRNDTISFIKNKCDLCSVDLNTLLKEDYFTLYYELICNNNKFKIENNKKENNDTRTIDSYLSTQLIELFILYHQKRVYSFYLKLNSLRYQWHHHTSFLLNLSSLFDYLMKQVGEETNQVSFQFFYRLNSLKEDFESFLEKFSNLTTTTINCQILIVDDYIKLGNSITDLKKKIQGLENDQNYFLSLSSASNNTTSGMESKIYSNIKDNYIYIFNIIRFSTAKLINDNNMCSDYPYQSESIHEEFMENYYHHNKMLLLQMVLDPHHLMKQNLRIIYIGERYNKEMIIKKDFFKLFPKQFRLYCKNKLNDCLNHYSKVFNFFLIDMNNYLVDFNYDLNLIPYENDLIIKGEVYYNTKNLLLFKWNKTDEEYILQALSKRSSQILRIEPYLLDYGHKVNMTFSFNELFYEKNIEDDDTKVLSSKKKTYHLYTTRYLKKLDDIIKHFLDNKSNASYANELKQTYDLLLNQKQSPVKLYEIDMLQNYDADNSYQMFVLVEKNQKAKNKKTHKTTLIDCDQDLTHVMHKLHDMGTSSVASSVSDISTILKKKQGRNIQGQQIENRFLALTIMVICFDIFIIIITVIFLIVQFILNKKLKDYYDIFVQEKRIECYFAHFSIEIFMTICVYDKEGNNISDRLGEYTTFLNMDLRPYLFDELIEKQKIFSNITNKFLNDLYSSNDNNIKQLSQSTVTLSFLSSQLNGNQLPFQKNVVVFSEGIKFFLNIINEIIGFSNTTSCIERSISIIHSDKEIPYFVNLVDIKLNNYQLNIYSLVLNFLSYYRTFNIMRELMYGNCLQYYKYHIIGLIIIFVLLCCSKATVVSLCFLSISIAKTILLNELNDINSKIDDETYVTYFKTQIKNIKIMCQLHQENPITLMDKIVKCKRLFYEDKLKEQHNKEKKLLQINNETDKVPNKKQIKESSLEELFKIPKLFLSTLIVVIIIVSFGIPVFLSFFLIKIKVVLDYTEINSLIESGLFIPAVMTNIMLLSNKAAMPIHASIYNTTGSVMTVIKSIEFLRGQIIKKDIYQMQYLSTLESLNKAMVTDSCQHTFEVIEDKILITIRERGKFNYTTFYDTICTIFNYDYVDYPFSFYDIEYRLQNFVTNSIVFDYYNIHRVLNDINAMSVFSILLFISRPLVNFYNTTAMHNKLFDVADNYTLIILIALLGDTMINCVVFYFLQKIVMGKFNAITKSAVTLNRSIIVNKE